MAVRSSAVAAVPGSADTAASDDDLCPDELVDRALSGDREAVAQLIGLVHPVIVRYCRSRVLGGGRPLTGADDVAQEVCLAVVAALPGYRRGETPFLGFVYGIAAHKVADSHRASARVRSIPVPDVPDTPDDDATPEQRAMRSAAATRIGEVLATLPERQQEVLRLRVVVGLSADQTASALSMSAGAVRVTQHRALAKLRELLTADDEANSGDLGWAEVIG